MNINQRTLNLHAFSRSSFRPLMALTVALVYGCVLLFTAAHSHGHYKKPSGYGQFSTSLTQSIQKLTQDGHSEHWHSDQHDCVLCKFQSSSTAVNQPLILSYVKPLFARAVELAVFIPPQTPTKRQTRAPPAGSV